MGNTDPAYLTQELALELRDLLRAQKRAPAAPPALEHRLDGRPPMVGILLQDLPSEGKADCAVIHKIDAPQTQRLSLLGNFYPAPGPAHFTLSFKGQKTGPLFSTINAADLQKALEGLSTIGVGNVKVTVGAQPSATTPPTPSGQTLIEVPGVWIVQFVGTFLQTTDTPPPAIPLLVAGDLGGGFGPFIVVDAASVWADTGRIETVNAVIPVGTPTPMRAGAQVGCVWFRGLGYGVLACEAREFSTTLYYY